MLRIEVERRAGQGQGSAPVALGVAQDREVVEQGGPRPTLRAGQGADREDGGQLGLAALGELAHARRLAFHGARAGHVRVFCARR